MILEPLFVANPLAQHVEEFMLGLIDHHDDAGGIVRSAGQKAAAQAMGGIPVRIEADLAGEILA